MKKTWPLLIGIMIGGTIGWTLGFLNLPFVNMSHEFWIGFMACLAFILFLITLLFIWNKRKLLLSLIGKIQPSSNKKSEFSTYLIISIFLALFIVLGSIISGFIIYKQDKLYKSQTIKFNEQIQEQVELIESIKMNKYMPLISNVLNKIDSELKNNPERKLSDGIISRVIALSNSLKPYRSFEGDSLSDIKLSPERGQLLVALCSMDIDSISFSKIKLETNFSAADLKAVNFKGVDLSYTNLRGADFQDAILSDVNLSGSDLRNTNFWGANLEKSNLSKTKLKRADLRWAIINDANLEGAVLNGAIMNNTQFIKANLSKITFHYADLSGAMLNGATLRGCNFSESILKKTNFSNADLTNVLLRNADFSQVILTDAKLTNSEVDENWFDLINQFQVIGYNEILETYKVIQDTVKEDNRYKYRLKRIK